MNMEQHFYLSIGEARVAINLIEDEEVKQALNHYLAYIYGPPTDEEYYKVELIEAFLAGYGHGLKPLWYVKAAREAKKSQTPEELNSGNAE